MVKVWCKLFLVGELLHLRLILFRSFLIILIIINLLIFINNIIDIINIITY